MADLASIEYRLAARPVGMPNDSHFARAIGSAPEPGPGKVRVRNLWLSVDPYMRGRMVDRESYVPPFEVGAVLEGGAVGEVVDSGDENFAPGDLVMSMLGWREAFTASAKVLQKLPKGMVPPQAFLGVAGMPGMTAYFGLLKIGALRNGETVFVSAGAGAVGSIVAQIAKIKECKVIATAGSDDKCDFLRSIGVDHAINYKAFSDSRGLEKALRAAAPGGIDVYFENVGGMHLEAAIGAMRPFGRIAVCGMIAGYNATSAEPGPNNLVMMIPKRLRIEGFIVTDHMAEAPAFLADMTQWIGAGKITVKETVLDGIDQTPAAFLSLFSGDNTGKMLVRL